MDGALKLGHWEQWRVLSKLKALIEGMVDCPVKEPGGSGVLGHPILARSGSYLISDLFQALHLIGIAEGKYRKIYGEVEIEMIGYVFE
jgi:hypothetical protein